MLPVSILIEVVVSTTTMVQHTYRQLINNLKFSKYKRARQNPSGRLESPFHLRTWSRPRWPSPTESSKCIPSRMPLWCFQATPTLDPYRFVDHGSVQRPLFYGLEIVRVLPGNAAQVIPTFFVGVSPPDILFSRRSPLASAGGHGRNCDLTNSPYRNTQ